ncbi:MAG: nucleotidyltransferase family protein [Candidatus Methanoperedens sp.]|nr:nucleotidyltransferase family protein [Candidatus Methanoperedens sp.]
MKKKIDRIIMKLRENKPVLEEKYGVKNLEVFGSYIRGEQKKGSDLDVLVEFSKKIDLFKYMELEEFMSKKLGVKVDLVMKDTLKPRIKDRVLKEAIPV